VRDKPDFGRAKYKRLDLMFIEFCQHPFRCKPVLTSKMTILVSTGITDFTHDNLLAFRQAFLHGHDLLQAMDVIVRA